MRLAKSNVQVLVMLAVWLAAVAPGLGAESASEADPGVALAIVYDTSGSMNGAVRDTSGQMTPKHVIARRALRTIVNRLERFVTNSPPAGARKVEAELIVFNNGRPTPAIPFGPFEAGVWRKAIAAQARPYGGTPLGLSVQSAGAAVLGSRRGHKHVLVLTDGMNTVGPDPARLMPGVRQAAERKKCVVFFHFVAFDVSARVFDPLKQLGATVVGAADEKQLNEQLEFIIERKVLLEAETTGPAGRKQ